MENYKKNKGSKNRMVSKFATVTYGLMVASLSGLGIAHLGSWALSPAKVVQTQDLNQDGIQDLIVEQGQGHKVPMYGVREGTNVVYLAAKEMEKRQKDSVVKIDYASIEAKLNEK